MNFLAENCFDFNKLMYESVPYISLKDFEVFSKRSDASKERAPAFGVDDPECVIFCNSQFLTIKNWLETEGRVKPDQTL